MALISVSQREFAEKLRRPDTQNEVRREDRTVLRENLSRANPEKTIQIARRFAAMRTTKLRMAIDPEFLSSTAEPSGGWTQVFLNTEPKTLRKGNVYSLPPRVCRPGIKSMCPPMPDALRLTPSEMSLVRIETHFIQRKTPTPSNRRFV
jgi:hypothetical protein